MGVGQSILEQKDKSFTGFAAHRPLGNINRSRKDTSPHSADFRARVNGCPYHEPASTTDAKPTYSS